MRKKRTAPTISSGSMADVAFLLLLFFLVSTTIVEEQGILVRLPQWEADPPKKEFPEGWLLKIIVNKMGKSMIDGVEVAPEQVYDQVLNFLSEKAGHPTRTPIISLSNDRGTPYQAYLEIYNELKRAYKTCREQEAIRRWSLRWEELNERQQKELQEWLPVVISEAE